MNSNKQGINNNCYRATNFDKKKKKETYKRKRVKNVYPYNIYQFTI